MVESLRILRTASVDPYHNLALEELLLEELRPGEVLLYLWQNRYTVVVGRNQNPWAECRVEQLERDGGHLARRLSGGGAVFHDMGNLNFTFLAREEHYDIGRQMDVVLEAARRVGVSAERSGRNDATAAGKKFSGNAFYRSAGRCLHHGTLLVDADMQNLSRYLVPSAEKLRSKGVQSVRARVCNLRELVPALTVAQMADAMREAFEAIYGLRANQLKESALDPVRLAALTKRFAGKEWLFGRPMPCSWQAEGRFEWGEATLQMELDRGRVLRARCYTDSMDTEFAQALGEALAGCAFNTADLARAVNGLPLPDGLPRRMAEDMLVLIERNIG